MLNESWKAKDLMMVNSEEAKIIRDIHAKAIDSGALCGKVMGAGGGGFLVFFVNPNKKKMFKQAMEPYICIEPKISSTGVHSILQ